jgi:tripartite-type tricarboxylate transporter receptor subunit TctC
MGLAFTCRAAARASLVTAILGVQAVVAQPAEQFYKGKALELFVGYATGGSNDLYARAVSRHLGRHVPGEPTIVVKNMPGAGSKVAANHIFNVAPQDGTVLGLLAATLPLEGKLGLPGVRFDAAKFNWLGRVGSGINVTMMRHDAPVKNIEDLLYQEATLSATTAGGPIYLFPYVLNNLIGTKFKIILGYPGSAQAMLAMERGETEGHSTAVEAVKLVHPDWISEKKVKFIVQYGFQKHPDLPDVPLAINLARNDEERTILRAVLSSAEVGKSVVTGPGVPRERVTSLREAFDRMVADPPFTAELTAQRVGVEPMSGKDLANLVDEIAAISPSMLDKIRKVYGSN